MRIEKLTIYGFGKHENLTLPINEALAVFYGNNEAGKTTIQQFIVQILFGFPLRNQGGNRYEPKAGGKYGGQLHLADEQYGKIVIERIKGKAAGDVTVYFEDGSRGADRELKKILRDFDRTSFDSIFSFSIHELQGLDKMTEEQLSRTLLASGTTGVDTITQLETELEKEMGNIFKRGGRNPQLNVLIEEMRNDERELKQHREQADLYGPYVEQLENVKDRMIEMAARENSISRELAEAGKQQQAAPLIQKKNSLEEQLSLISVSSFPADGSRRMDLLTERISEATAKRKHAENELAKLPLPPETENSSRKEELKDLLEKESDWHRFLSAYRDTENEAEKLKENLDRHLGLIGMPLDTALQFDVSLISEEKFVYLAEEVNKEEENSRFRKRELQDEKKRLIEAEKEMSYLESSAPTEEQLKTAAEWPAIASQLAEAKALKRISDQAGNQSFSYVLLILGFAAMVTGLLRADMLIILVAAGAALAGLWSLWNARRKYRAFDNVDELIKRFGGREIELEELQQKIAKYNRKVEDTLQIISSTDKKIEELENEVNHSSAKEEFEAYLQHLGIASTGSKSTIIELFKTIRSVQEIHAKLKRTDAFLSEARNGETEWLEKAAAATGKHVQSGDLYTVIRSEAKKLNDLYETNRRINEKRETLATEAQRQTSYLKELELEKQKLLDECGAADIEEFHQFHLEWIQKKELGQELKLISSQLEAIGIIEESHEGTGYSAEARIAELESELAQLRTVHNQLMDERAELQQGLNHLLTDEAYETKLQIFEEKKAKFNELAHDWSVNKAISEAIRHTMSDLKEKSLPAVLDKACDYFKRFTEGSYSGMEIHPDGYFEAIRNDGIRFRIIELSQATKEQAYLALRLSLAVSMQSSHPFPIIMDDPFVHFDRLRLQQVINLIQELQRDHQFIYFTCHEDMCQVLSGAQIIDVANTGRSVYL